MGPEFTNKDDINNTVFSSFARVGGVVTCNLYAKYAGEDVIFSALVLMYLSIYLSIYIHFEIEKTCSLARHREKKHPWSLKPTNLNPVRKKRKKNSTPLHSTPLHPWPPYSSLPRLSVNQELTRRERGGRSSE